jgi:hypothetical protein
VAASDSPEGGQKRAYEESAGGLPDEPGVRDGMAGGSISFRA